MDFMAKSTPKKLVALVLSAVMALSCLATGAVSTASAREADELDTAGIKVTAGSQEGSTPISNAFDDNKGTMWETNWSSGGDTSSYDKHYVVYDTFVTSPRTALRDSKRFPEMLTPAVSMRTENSRL